MNIINECSRLISLLLELKQSGQPPTRQIVNTVIDREAAIDDAIYKQGRPKRPKRPRRIKIKRDKTHGKKKPNSKAA